MIQEIIDLYGDEAILFADGLDDAVIGIESNTTRIVYSKAKCIDIMMNENNMSYDEAVEYLEFNTFGAYVGNRTPIWVDDNF